MGAGWWLGGKKHAWLLRQMGVWLVAPTYARWLTAICDPPPVHPMHLGFLVICTPLHMPILRHRHLLVHD